METIYHIAQKDEWEGAKKLGHYHPSRPEGCPFIHFSFAHQVLEVANAIFHGRRDLVLLEVKQSMVEKDLKLEAPQDLDEAFPHLYRDLSPQDVSREMEFLPSPSGRFERLPGE